MDSLATKNVESMISENFSLAQTMALLAKEVDLLAKELIDIFAIEMELFGKNAA